MNTINDDEARFRTNLGNLQVVEKCLKMDHGLNYIWITLTPARPGESRIDVLEFGRKDECVVTLRRAESRYC